MSNRSALVAVAEAVRTDFVARGITARVSVGWRERMRQSNQGPGGANRVVFTPGGPSGAGGSLTKHLGKVGPGGNPRPLLGWDRQAQVSAWAIDPTNLDDEEKQIEATEILFEEVVRSLHKGGLAAVQWVATSWVQDVAERPFGRELVAAFVLQSVFYDVPNSVAYPAPIINRGSETT